MKFIGDDDDDDDDDGWKRNSIDHVAVYDNWMLDSFCNGQQQPIVGAKSKAFI
jgi:hypothetical protein